MGVAIPYWRRSQLSISQAPPLPNNKPYPLHLMSPPQPDVTAKLSTRACFCVAVLNVCIFFQTASHLQKVRKGKKVKFSSEFVLFAFSLTAIIQPSIICRLLLFLTTNHTPTSKFQCLCPHPDVTAINCLQVHRRFCSCLYPRHLCRRVYSFRFSVRPFVCSLVGSFVR